MLISQASTSFPSFSSLSRLSLASRTFQSALLLPFVERGDGLGRIGDGHLHKPKPCACRWPCLHQTDRDHLALFGKELAYGDLVGAIGQVAYI